MPASVRSSTVAPSARAAIRPGSRAFSTDSWNVTTRPVNVTPRSDASRCSRRVSSTASTSAVAITSRSRGPTSPGCPRGAPPSTNRPLTERACHDDCRRPACRGPARACERRGAGGSFHYPDGMAVLVPERAEAAPEPLPAPSSAARRWPVPHPRRDTTPPLPRDARLSWVLTAILGVVSLAGRLWGISYPKDLLFDEAYYPPQAHQLLTWGFEYNRGYSFIVHPPLGKWLIAAGEQVFGYSSLGWRFPSAVAGAITVVVLFRLTRRLTGSTLMGLIAGLLLALDGFAFTLSRIGLLDVFLQTLVIGAVACLVVDRDKIRARVRDGTDRLTDTGLRATQQGWPIAAGSVVRPACAVKWSGVWFLAF